MSESYLSAEQTRTLYMQSEAYKRYSEVYDEDLNLPSKGNLIVTKLSVINFGVPLNAPLTIVSDQILHFKLYPTRKK